MSLRPFYCVLALIFGSVAHGETQEPVLRLETGGPTSYVTSLAFSPDGKTLYAGGLDKVVRVWRLDSQTNRFVLDPYAFRVPIGPGTDGAINAVAVSPDGEWLAAGGLGVPRGGAGFREPGLILPSLGGMTADMRRDQGTIYLFNTQTRVVYSLRGHLGTVLALTFAPSFPDKPPILVSAAREWDEKSNTFQGVVRAWNVSSATGGMPEAPTAKLAKLGGLPNPEIRPSLSARHTGNEATDIRVAIAWGDGLLRVWDAGNVQAREASDGVPRSNIAIGFLPDGQILSGALSGATGHLKWWKPAENADPQTLATLPLDAPDGASYLLPRALGLFSAAGDGNVDQAAVVVRSPREKALEYRLRVVDLAKRTIVGKAFLWQGDDLTPTLATSPKGALLAVAGNRRHEILIYSLPLKEEAAPHQVIRGVGATMRYVSFAKNEAGQLGLQMSGDPLPSAVPPRAVTAGDLLFSFAGRGLTSLEGWQSVRPNGWELTGVTPSRNGNAVIAWRSPDSPFEQRTPIEGKETRTATAAVVLPPIAPSTTPILAVAFMDKESGPLLGLYNAKTGAQIRECRGHAEPIRRLAASPDGRFLASAADDQTVCVWSLTDLDQVLGVRGLLKGVAVTQEKSGPVVVGRVDENSPANDKLAKGDEILGMVRTDGKLLPIASPRDFYDAVSHRPPGEVCTLRIKNREDVKLPVAQGVDERKPLLSLFITQPLTDQSREWIAWTPLGPYDSSGPRVEKYLGWHFNTGRADAPTAFALADQYRDKYYRPGIVKHLLEQGEVGLALDGWRKEQAAKKLPRPALTLWVEELGPDAAKNPQGEVLARQPKGRIKLAIDGLPSLEAVESATWSVDKQTPQSFNLAKATCMELSADARWTRGVQKVRVALRTKEDEPQEYFREMTIRYQPPPPKIESALPPRVAVAEPEFKLSASISPGLTGQSVRGELRVGDKKTPLKSSPLPQGKLTVDQRIDSLTIGENIIELRAFNTAAPEEERDRETEKRTWIVVYTPKEKTPPPVIALDGVNPNQPLIVHEPKITVRGKITAKGKLAKAEWGQGTESHDLAGFKSGTSNEFNIAEEWALKPGPQSFHLIAQAADGESAEVRVAVEYQPPLPEVIFTSPAADAVFYEGEAGAEVVVAGRLTSVKDPQPFRLQLLANDTPPMPIEPKDAQFQAKVRLKPGDNRLQIKLSNAWKMVRTQETHVRFLRPPEIRQLLQPSASTRLNRSETPFAVQVHSPLDEPLRPEDVMLAVNGRRVAKEGIRVREVKNSPKLWAVQADPLELVPGKNVVTLAVKNAEAECRKPGVWEFFYDPPKPATKAVVEILSPRVNVAVTEPALDVTFAVRSESPLKHVEIVAGGKRFAVDASKLEKNNDGVFLLKSSKLISLEPGTQAIQVSAINDAGVQESRVTVSYAPPPVRLVLDEPATHTQDGKLLLPPSPDGEILLQGRVLWQKESDEKALQTNPLVRVYVNGFQQRPSELGRRQGKSREFEARIILTQAADNKIELDLPGLPQEAGARLAFAAVCDKPQKPKTLHLLIVGVGEPDGGKLTDKVLQTLTKRRDLAFDRVAEPIVLNEFVSRGHVFTQLRVLKERIKDSSDVAMIYWLGRESVTLAGSYFLTSESENDPDLTRSAIQRETLTSALGDTLGARVVFFDLRRTGGVELEANARRWPEESRIGLLRYAWPERREQPAVHLATALAESLGDAGKPVVRLEDVAQTAARTAAKWKDDRQSPVMFDEFMPPGLRALVIGRKP